MLLSFGSAPLLAVVSDDDEAAADDVLGDAETANNFDVSDESLVTSSTFDETLVSGTPTIRSCIF